MRTKLAFLMLAAFAATARISVAEPPNAESPVAVSNNAGALTIRADVPNEGLEVTLSGPDGATSRQTAAAGGAIRIGALDENGAVRADGAWTWEAVVRPAVDRATRERARAARANGDDVEAARLMKGHVPARTLVRSGSFRVVGGQIVTEGLLEPAFRPETTAAGRTANAVSGPVVNDVVNADDVIVQGSLCVGLDCVNNESFGFDTIRLKENNTRIKFDDTSASAGFPANDWQLTANDSASGGANKFSIEDITGAKVPFTVTAGAPTNSFFMASSGKVGFRTATPVLDLHMNTSDTPAVRFEQNNSGGFTAQTWDVAGNEANFFVRDVTGGSRLPLRIRPGAPTSSIDVNAAGNVGIGTASPTQGKLQVADGPLAVIGTGADANANAIKDIFFGMGHNLTTGPAMNIGYAGQSFGRSAGFFNVRPDASAAAPNPSLRFATSNVQRVIIDNEGFIGIGTDVSALNPDSPIHHTSGARLTAGGTWQNASSRALKHDIADLSSESALAAMESLKPVTFAYDVDPAEKHVGFVAEDVPDLVASKDRKSLSPMDIVAVLTKVAQDQQRTIEEQQKALLALRAEVEALKAAR